MIFLLFFWFGKLVFWDCRARRPSHEKQSAEAVAVAERNQRREPSDIGCGFDGTRRRGPIEAVEDSELLWRYWTPVQRRPRHRLCRFPYARRLLRLLQSSLRGTLPLQLNFIIWVYQKIMNCMVLFAEN